MNLNESLKALFANLKANPRLRWGVLSIVGVLWFYSVLELRDAVQRKNEAYTALNKKIARMQGAAEQAEWPSRLKEAHAVQFTMEKRLWRESTIGLAQATINDWLTQLTQQANLTKVQLQVAAQEDGGVKKGDGSDGVATPAGSDLWKVSAKLAFDFSPQSFYPLLGHIATNEKKVIVESLVIRSNPVPKAELLLVTYFRKPTAAQSAEEGAANGSQ